MNHYLVICKITSSCGVEVSIWDFDTSYQNLPVTPVRIRAWARLFFFLFFFFFPFFYLSSNNWTLNICLYKVIYNRGWIDPVLFSLRLITTIYSLSLDTHLSTAATAMVMATLVVYYCRVESAVSVQNGCSELGLGTDWSDGSVLVIYQHQKWMHLTDETNQYYYLSIDVSQWTCFLRPICGWLCCI